MAELIRATLGDRADQPFRPFARYDPALDRITVLTRDCDFAEGRYGVLVLLQEKQSREGQYVGFEIERAKRFCRRHRLPHSGSIHIKSILDAIVLEMPVMGSRVVVAKMLVSQLESSEVSWSG